MTLDDDDRTEYARYFFIELFDGSPLLALDVDQVSGGGAGDGEVLVRGEEDGQPLGAERVQVHHGNGGCAARSAGGIGRERSKHQNLPDTVHSGIEDIKIGT